eukprot:2561271-Rhodomonas_salina.2
MVRDLPQRSLRVVLYPPPSSLLPSHFPEPPAGRVTRVSLLLWEGGCCCKGGERARERESERQTQTQRTEKWGPGQQ